MTEIAVDTLRLRGPHARRLAAVAARALPAALERALADVGDVRLDRVEVCLDFDPSDYDDQTLAILWADAIRARVLAQAPGHQSPVTSTVSSAGSSAVFASSRTPAAAEVLAALRDWAFVGRRSATAAVLPSSVLALGDPAVARAVRAEVGPDEWAHLLAVLGNALRPMGNLASGTPSPTHHPQATDPEVRDRDVLTPEVPTLPSHPGLPAGEDEDGAPQGVLDRLATLGELVAAAPGDVATSAASAGVDLTTVTRAAGLVLLYPWLADHCRRAEALHPWLDVRDVREAALAVIVDPDDPALADDPVVGLLAGRPDTPAEPRERVELTHRDDVVESADRMLASFAALLPGFGQSTGLFVRDSWIRRLGVLHRDRDPALLVAATHPLDVLLPMLPYPIGLVKLPWSAPLSVRFAP